MNTAASVNALLLLTAHLRSRLLCPPRRLAYHRYPAEQWPLLEPGPLRDAFMGAGSNSKQNTIASIDWTITLMLFSSILSVLNYPDEMAVRCAGPPPIPTSPASPTTLPQPHHPPCPSLQVVRLRCDTKGYFNWRDQYAAAAQARTHSPRPPSQAHHSAGYHPRYIGAMNIRAHRRDLNVADRWLAFQSTRDRFKEAVRVRWRQATARLRGAPPPSPPPSFGTPISPGKGPSRRGEPSATAPHTPRGEELAAQAVACGHLGESGRSPRSTGGGGKTTPSS